MSEREERNYRLMMQILAFLVGLFLGILRGETWLMNITSAICGSIIGWLLIYYIISAREINLFADLAEWWAELRNPPRYPFD